jgi:hypothetical protein
MSTKMVILPEHFAPVEYIFALLNLCKQGIGNNFEKLSRALHKRELWSLGFQPCGAQWPHLNNSFWIKLCRAGAILDDNPSPMPTLFAETWLSWSLYDQIFYLCEAWANVPLAHQTRQGRQRILVCISNGLELNETQIKQTLGLQDLGIFKNNRLTDWGRAVWLAKQGNTEQTNGLQKWIFKGTNLITPFPPKWDLIWHLERFLDPIEPGKYAFTSKTLHLAAQGGALISQPTLIEIVEKGLEEPFPERILQSIPHDFPIQLLQGSILQFSDKEVLEQLRKSSSWRMELDHLLSSRHVLLDTFRAKKIIQRLYRKGLLRQTEFSQSTAQNNHSVGLYKADLTYLLSVMLIVSSILPGFASPPGLMGRIISLLDSNLCAAAAEHATKLLHLLRPSGSWKLDEENPPCPKDELLEALQEAIDKEEVINILYHAPGGTTPEYRHLSPLLLEQRGARFYLIAYCHTRKANRTFRVDRMEIIDLPQF